MQLYKLLLVVILGSSIAASIVLFGDSPSLRGSLIHRARRWILNSLQSSVSFYRSVDNRTNGGLTWCLEWSIPVFYVSVITGCFYLFFTETYLEVLPLNIKHSIFHNLYIFATITLVYLSTILVTYTDPGRISSSTMAHRASTFFPYNDLIFHPKDCATCKLPKPARSKHCSTCGHCIMLYDHHCIWVNNCIGYYNYRWFFLFLVSNINLLFYGGLLSYWSLVDQFPSTSWWHRITSTTNANKTTGVFLILCSIFVVITSLFTALHLRYLYLGVTTNECDKWSELEYLVELGTLYKILDKNFPENYVEKSMVHDKSTDSYLQAYISLRNERILFVEGDESIPQMEPVISVEKDLVNIYDLGFWGNVNERLWNVYQI
ncbi:palmitoyltransferase Swf1p [[Candida] anglica]